MRNKSNRLLILFLTTSLVLVILLGTFIAIAAYNAGKIKGIETNIYYNCIDK